MIIQWLDRLKLGQWLAPDPNYHDHNSDDVESGSDFFWSTVAPDPNFAPKIAIKMPEGTTKSSEKQVMFSPTMMVHHHRRRQAGGGGGSGNEQVPIPSPSQQQQQQKMITKSPYYNSPQYSGRSYSSEPGEFVNQGTTSGGSSRKQRTPRKTPLLDHPAADITTEVKETIKRVVETRRFQLERRNDTVIQLFGRVTNVMQPKARIILQKRIRDDPTVLTRRSYRPSMEAIQCPDGSTLFHAAIVKKQLPNMQMIWTIAKELGDAHSTYQLQCTNTVGETAWHYAAQTGDEAILRYVTSLYHETFGADAEPPVDLSGFTPLATGMTTTGAEGSARKVLYDETDPSVVGNPLPALYRSVEAANAQVGMAELNGERCQTEDYTVADATSDDSVLLVAIADGHGDQGKIAQFVAQGFTEALQLLPQPIADWNATATQVCLSLDNELRILIKHKIYFGGAVAIFCAVTVEQIIVANVGDCRAILIQKCSKQQQQQHPVPPTTTVGDLIDATEKLTLHNVDLDSSTKKTKTTPTAIPLSNDHKPDRPDERARIEAVDNMIVEERSFQENGETVTLSRIKDTADSEKGAIAFSRSFGDFDFKTRKDLDVQSQVLIAVPELTIRNRSCDDDLFVVLACDGVWDVMSNEMVADFCYQRRTMQPTAIADDIVQEALRLKSKDNLSAAVIDLRSEDSALMSETSRKLFVSPNVET